MAYRDDISALGAQHHWDFDGDSVDQIGSADGTSTGVIFTDSAIAEDASNCMTTNGTTDRVTLPTTTDINNAAQGRKAISGWFETTAIQTPPNRIYGEGDNVTSFAFVMAMGNNVMAEVDSASFTLQVFAERVLKPNRVYHLCAIFEGNGFSNEFRFYLDGVKQTSAEPADRQPDAATLDARGVGEFGDPAGTVGVGGGTVTLVAPVNGRYQHWASFDGASAELTDIEVREELFEKGALTDATISAGTESAMQTALDALADTARPDAPLCIRVEAVTGDGDLTLIADNITFDALASIHVQYMGTGTLTWVNTNGSDASIGSTPGSGNVVFQTEVNLQLTVLDASTLSPVSGARVLLEADTGGPLTVGTDIISGTTNASGVISSAFNYQSEQPVTGRARQGSSPFFETASILATIDQNGLDLTVLLLSDG